MKYDTRLNTKDLVYDPRRFMSLSFPVIANHPWRETLKNVRACKGLVNSHLAVLCW